MQPARVPTCFLVFVLLGNEHMHRFAGWSVSFLSESSHIVIVFCQVLYNLEHIKLFLTKPKEQ